MVQHGTRMFHTKHKANTTCPKHGSHKNRVTSVTTFVSKWVIWRWIVLRAFRVCYVRSVPLLTKQSSLREAVKLLRNIRKNHSNWGWVSSQSRPPVFPPCFAGPESSGRYVKFRNYNSTLGFIGSRSYSETLMVQWKMAGYLKGKDPIGDTPIFHFFSCLWEEG